MLEARPLSAAYILRKIPLAAKAIRSLERKGLIAGETVQAERDPLRAPSARLRVELARQPEGVKLPKAERELLAYLETPPRLAQSQGGGALGEELPARAARSLARKGLVTLEAGAVADRPACPRPPPPRV